MEARSPLLVLAVVGRKGAGKTRVVEGLVRELRARGLRVATAKHVPEEGFSLDKPGKDSWRHAEAGAEAVTLVAPSEVATIRRLRGRQPGLEDVLAWASCGCDVLIMEGFSATTTLSTSGASPAMAEKPSMMSTSRPQEAQASTSSRPGWRPLRRLMVATSPGATRVTASAPASACLQLSLPGLSKLKPSSGTCLAVATLRPLALSSRTSPSTTRVLPAPLRPITARTSSGGRASNWRALP